MAHRRHIKEDMVAEKGKRTYWRDDPKEKAEIYEEHKKEAVHVKSAVSRLEYQDLLKKEINEEEEISFDSDDGGKY